MSKHKDIQPNYRCNATDSAKCKWLTVTYATVMTDGKQAFLDAKLFLRRFILEV